MIGEAREFCRVACALVWAILIQLIRAGTSNQDHNGGDNAQPVCDEVILVKGVFHDQL